MYAFWVPSDNATSYRVQILILHAYRTHFKTNLAFYVMKLIYKISNNTETYSPPSHVALNYVDAGTAELPTGYRHAAIRCCR
jgi:hypothetical protein